MTVEEFYNTVCCPKDLMEFIEENDLEDVFEINDILDEQGLDRYVDNWVCEEIHNDYWFNILETLQEIPRGYSLYSVYGIYHIIPFDDDDFACLIGSVANYAVEHGLLDESNDDDEESHEEDPEDYFGEEISDSEFDRFISELVALPA